MTNYLDMKKVLVTGITGFIGQHCAAELLKHGYAVKGSLRNLAKKEEVIKGIKKVIDPKGNIEFCQLDLLIDNGWAEAMQDCEFVLHVASPYFTSEPKDPSDLIKPAVEGTLRALKAAKQAGIKRVVLTSSIVAMLEDIKGTVAINQNSWTNVEAKNATAYVKSKTLAEKSAWDFIKNQDKEQPLELVVINPGSVYGPTLTGDLSGESMTSFAKLISGKMPLLPRISINMSDVRDIAQIHVAALENKSANGQRFIVATEKNYSIQELAQLAKSNGYKKISTLLAPNFLLKLMAPFNSDLKGLLPYIGNSFIADVSNTMKTFNWKPIYLEKTVKDTAQSITENL